MRRRPMSEMRRSKFAALGLISLAILACGNRGSEPVTVNAIPAGSGSLVRSVEISGVLAPP